MQNKTSDAGREARLAYRREYYRRNKEKQKEYMDRYWARKAEKMAAEKAKQ